MVKGLQRSSKKPQAKLPVLASTLRKFVQFMDLSDVNDLSVWACFACAFYGLFRMGELLGGAGAPPLTVADVSFQNNHRMGRYAVLCLQRSKTDQEGKGASIPLPCVDDVTCPVCSLQKLLEVEHSSGKRSDPIFSANGRPLSTDTLKRRLHQLATRTGLNATSYSGHSFRRGGATAAAINGMTEMEIKTLGRWSSNAYLRYVLPDAGVRLRLASSLCSA
jgi:hypothetical protein